jgi:Flp pilus assembly protein TadG
MTMSTSRRRDRRSGAHTVEAALVLPVLLFCLLTLIAGGLAVFHYQQVAFLAQEAARWACVRGEDYQEDTNQASPTVQQILQEAVLPRAVGMDASQLSLQVRWIDQATGAAQDWDAAPKHVRSITPQGTYVTNTVQVSVTYTWSPGVLAGPFTLSSTCSLPMSQ